MPANLLLALPLLAAAVVYFPLISGYFISDDFLNLYGIVNADTLEYLLRPHGSHLLVARNVLFMLFHALFGVRAELYFVVVLATHLLNVFLLQRIVLRWTRSLPLAALGGLLWGTCPLQAGAMEWYSVYGQVVVATLLLIVLDQASRFSNPADPPSRSVLFLWPLLFAIASTCFGIGIALALVSPLVLFLLLPRSRRRLEVCAALLGLALVTYPAYRALIAWHDQLSGSGSGIFTLYITLAGLNYPEANLRLFGYLLSYAATNLPLGFAALGGPFPSTTSVVATGLSALALITTLVSASPQLRRRVLALLIAAASCYAVIAAGRAMYTSTTDLAAAATRARYHYAGTVPLAILICLMLDRLTTPLRNRSIIHGGLLFLWLAVAAVFYTRAGPFIDTHVAARTETMNVLNRIRAAIAGAPPGSDVRIVNRPFRSIGPMLFDPRSGFPGWAGVYTIFFPANVVDGRRVQFVVNDRAIVEAAAAGKRTRDLLIVGETPTKPGAPPGPHSSRP